jgi:hypothetical protein
LIFQAKNDRIQVCLNLFCAVTETKFSLRELQLAQLPVLISYHQQKNQSILRFMCQVSREKKSHLAA